MSAPGPIQALKQALAGLSLRQSHTENNLANADTPGFSSTHVDFESALRAQLDARVDAATNMRTTRPGHFTSSTDASGVGTSVEEASLLLTRNDGSKVDVDGEVMTMSETSLRYAAVTGFISSQFRMARNVITEGRR